MGTTNALRTSGFVRRIICRNLKLIDHLSLVLSQRMRGGISELHSDRIQYLIIVTLRKFVLPRSALKFWKIDVQFRQ